MAEATTSLIGVDLKRGIATYLVTVPEYKTLYNVTVFNTRMVVSNISTIITEIVRSYYLPDGRLYTVIRVPTRLLADVDVVTRVLGVETFVTRVDEEGLRLLRERLTAKSGERATSSMDIVRYAARRELVVK